MKIFYLLVLGIITATGCQTGNHQLTKSPLEPDNVNNRLIINSLENEMKEQKEINPDIEKLVQIIKEGKSNEQVLFTYMAMKLGEERPLLSTSKAISTAMDITLNNMANAMSNGFKKETVHFQDGKIISVRRNWAQGDLKATGNQLDLAIAGNGFFKVLSNGEEVYTRDGSFKLSRQGYMETVNGDRLQPEVSIPMNTVSIIIDGDGTLVGLEADGNTATTTAQLTICNFINPSGLNSLGKGYYSPSGASGDPVESNPGVDGLGTIAQGFLEMSNVDLVEEMVHLQKLQSWKKAIDRALLAIND